MRISDPQSRQRRATTRARRRALGPGRHEPREGFGTIDRREGEDGAAVRSAGARGRAAKEFREITPAYRPYPKPTQVDW